MRLSAHFGARLAAIRVDRGLTLTELAALIGRTKTTIGRWEHGGPAEIHRSDVAKCARVLRCSRKILLASLDEPIPPPPSSWLRTRRQIKQRLAAVTGKRPGPYRRGRLAPDAGRISIPPPPKPSALDRALDLLLKLSADELIALRTRLDRAGRNQLPPDRVADAG
jgi:transcriptional regulator with XRE-family HTH domain